MNPILPTPEILQNDLLIKAIKGEPTNRPPVWLMRQAGRILPQYNALRQKVNGFKTLVETPELACEVTLQPVEELGVDAAIIFSDILVVCEAMGVPYQMQEAKGPYFENTISPTQTNPNNLLIANPHTDIAYTIEAIKLTKRALNNKIPLIGFAGAPFTLFAYMVEGGGSKTFSKAKKMLYAHPEWSHKVLERITLSTINYLKAQVEAGANVVQIFDSWAGILSPEQYQIFSAQYIHQICEALAPLAPVTIFAKGAWFAYSYFATQTACSCIGVDWNVTPQTARKLTQNAKTLQGNADPCLLYANPETIQKQTLEMIQNFGKQRYIANLGHGVYPDTPLYNVKCFVNTIKNIA